MTAKEEFKTMQEYIAYMQGTCNSFDFDGWSDDELQEFDESLFECASCGWWCEVGDWGETKEETDGDVCSDCGD